MKIHHHKSPNGVRYQYWYDRSTRCWWAIQTDAEGNQVNDAVDAYTKTEIIRAIKDGFVGTIA